MNVLSMSFDKITVPATLQMAAYKAAIGLLRIHMYYSKFNPHKRHSESVPLVVYT